MAAPGMGQMSALAMQNMQNMGQMPQQITPQQHQQMLHVQQQQQHHQQMQAQFQQQQQHQIGQIQQQSQSQSPQQMMMHQQQQHMGHPGPGQQQMSPMQQQQQQQHPGMIAGQTMPQMRPQMQSQQQQPPPQPEMTPVLQAKMLLPQLKESLANLMKVTAQSIHQNGLIDSCSKSLDTPPQKFEKYLEEFYAVCDQMELNLRLAIECNNACAESNKHTPIPVQMNRQDPTQTDSQTYAQFLSLVKMQATQAKDVRDLLTEHAKKFSEKPS